MTETYDEIQGIHWLNKDHAQALCLNHQFDKYQGKYSIQQIVDLNRFCECAEDGEGYDVPKERMKNLKEIGLIQGGPFGYYKTTDEGNELRSAWYD